MPLSIRNCDVPRFAQNHGWGCPQSELPRNKGAQNHSDRRSRALGGLITTCIGKIECYHHLSSLEPKVGVEYLHRCPRHLVLDEVLVVTNSTNELSAVGVAAVTAQCRIRARNPNLSQAFRDAGHCPTQPHLKGLAFSNNTDILHLPWGFYARHTFAAFFAPNLYVTSYATL